MFVNLLAVPAFGEHFWKPYARGSSECDNAQAGVDAGTSQLSYSAQRHGTHADFCRGSDFEQYKEEVRANLAFLADFCREQQMPDAPDIALNLQVFFSHRFDEHHYFSTRADIVDSAGKQSLDEFCRMIRRAAIDTHTKQIAIRDFAVGITQCADGAVSNLVGAARKLAKAAGGLRGTLWAIKEEAARNALQEVAQEHFSAQENYLGNEIHYVTTAWNTVADRYGFEKDPDGIKMPQAQDYRFLVACAARLESALTPDRLSLVMAETLQARFNSQIPMAIQQLSGAWTAGVQERCTEQLQEIGDAFGLTCDDELHFDPVTQTWAPRESDLRLKSFLKLKEAGDTRTYTLRTDPSLIALDLLRGMAQLGLLQERDTPRMHGQWAEPEGIRAALFVYGALAWVGRTHSQDALALPLLASKGLEVEPATVPDLLLWRAARPADPPFTLEAVIAQIIRATDIAQLADMPARWLRRNTLAENFLRRLGRDQGMAYLALNAADLGDGFSDRKRQQLLYRILCLGMGKAIPTLLGNWFTSPSKQIDMIYRLLRHEAMPALHHAMHAEDPKAAVQTWYAPLRESGLLAWVAPQLAELLDLKDGGSSTLAWAVCQGRAPAVDAFFVLLKNILTDSAAQWHMKDALPRILLTADSLHAPALSFAMAMGHAPVVRAFYAGIQDLLTDPALAGPIRSPLLEALPALLIADIGEFDSGLAYALGNGKTEVIEVFHEVLKDLLNDALIGPRILIALSDMLAAKDGDGEPGIAYARRNGHDATVAAFEAILADPAIQPHISQDLVDPHSSGPAMA